MTWTPWRQAWHEALYGPRGFYRQPVGPAGHFSTAAQGAPLIGEVLAAALVRWLATDGLTTFVDMGCGRGELLEHVHRLAPAVSCVGVDVVERPSSLSPGITWLRSPGGALLPDELTGLTGALVLANEWLDVVPCTVAGVDETGALREVLVHMASGAERLGDPLAGAELLWCGRFWPVDDAEPGVRVEVGSSRDAAWDDLLSRIDRGVAVAVDYGHLRGDRPVAGTLAGFRDGYRVVPVPDGSCDLTAHVAMDTLRHDELADQRSALRRLGTSGRTPDHALARSDPAAYLQGLSAASAATALTAVGGLGSFVWAITRVP